MRPTWHLLLSDTDVAPTALFEIEELVRLCAKTCHAMLEACTPGVIVGTEPYQDINSMQVWSSSQAPPPRHSQDASEDGSWRPDGAC